MDREGMTSGTEQTYIGIFRLRKEATTLSKDKGIFRRPPSAAVNGMEVGALWYAPHHPLPSNGTETPNP